jgi:hypothetical protein
MEKIRQQARVLYTYQSDELLKWEKEFKEELMKKRVSYFYNLYAAYKQKRKAQELLSTKKILDKK